MSFLKFIGEKAAAGVSAEKQAGMFDSFFKVTDPNKFGRISGKPPATPPQAPAAPAPTPKPMGMPQRPVNQPFRAPPPGQVNQNFAQELPGRMSELAWLTGFGDRPGHLGPRTGVPGAPAAKPAAPPAPTAPSAPSAAPAGQAASAQQLPPSVTSKIQSVASAGTGLAAMAAPFTRFGRFAGPLGVAAQVLSPTPEERWGPANWLDAGIGIGGWGSAMVRPTPWHAALAIPDAKQWWSKGPPTREEIGYSPEDGNTFRGRHAIYASDFQKDPLGSIKRVGSAFAHPLDATKMVWHDLVEGLKSRKQRTGSYW